MLYMHMQIKSVNDDKIELYYPYAWSYWFSMGRGSGLTASCLGYLAANMVSQRVAWVK